MKSEQKLSYTMRRFSLERIPSAMGRFVFVLPTNPV